MQVTMDLDRASIERELALRSTLLGRPLVIVESTTSTNDDAKQAARDGAPSGAAFIADTQTSGRGRLGRSWHSPPGENLYASFVLRPSLPPSSAPVVTLAAGLAVADIVAPLVPGRTVALKWPNDVLINDCKVAGILTEAQLSDARASWIVIGIGINVRATTFPAEIASRATSLALAGASELDRGAIFVALAVALSARIEILRDQGTLPIIADLAARDALLGRAITVDGAPATALGIAEDGALRIRRLDGETTILSGEVRLGNLHTKIVRPQRPT
jgi:BirA family transcriptional regulator, biotin operon repressor / biotin---[acetyl-CoA-carboxylase] ligase